MWESILAYLQANPVEAIGTVLTIVCVWLTARENVWGWIAGLISTCCYLYVFYQVGLIGDVLLQIYFLLTGIYGWYHWQYSDQKPRELPVSRSHPRDLINMLLLGAVAALALGALLSLYPKAAIPFVDAIPATFSVIGQWMLTKKKIENWLVWIFVNILSIGIYFYKDLLLTAVLYFILLLMAVNGYRKWNKSMQQAGPK